MLATTGTNRPMIRARLISKRNSMLPSVQATYCSLLLVVCVLPPLKADEEATPLQIGTRRELFVDRYLIDRLENAELRLQAPHDEGVVVGPVIDRRSRERLLGWIEAAVQGGARVLTGGEVADGVLRPTRTKADRATSAPAARPKRPIPWIAVQPIFQDRGKIHSNCEPNNTDGNQIDGCYS